MSVPVPVFFAFLCFRRTNPPPEIRTHTGAVTSTVSAHTHTNTNTNTNTDKERLSSMCSSYNCCELSDTESCSMKDMPPNETTLVLTAGAKDGSQCIFGDTYGFQVVPGATDKVLFYFQGGGACWDKVSTAAGLCTTTISPNAPTGVFDRENSENPFQDYTIVHALYCSGDVWAGQHTADYTHRDSPVTQYGYNNGKSTMDWLTAQVNTQFWADKLLTNFPSVSAAVVPDSYAGVFPPGTIGPLMKIFGVCETDLVPTAMQADCDAGELSISNVVQSHITKFPQYPFAFIQSKIDAVQQSFYVMVGLTSRNASAVITPSRFYSGVNGIFTSYNKQSPNFLTFLVDGPMHCFTPMDIMYSTSSAGPYGKRHKQDSNSLTNWLKSFPLSSGQAASTVCEGTVESTSVSASESEGGEDREDSIENQAHQLYSYAQQTYTYLQASSLDNTEEGGVAADAEKDRWSSFNDKTKYCSHDVVPKSFTSQ
eukprot:GSChrysophyteH2.ASY1.ANO1.1273.1 assembled CDS